MRAAARWLWIPAALAAAAALAQEPAAVAPAARIPAARIEQVRFIPPRFTVGDPVELQVVLVGLAAGFEPGFPRAAATAASPLDPIVIDGIAVTPLAGGRHVLRVSFRSFRPGSAALPAIDLGGGSLLELPQALTAATLPAGVGELEPARGPMVLPGTALRLTAVIAVLLVCPPPRRSGRGALRAGSIACWPAGDDGGRGCGSSATCAPCPDTAMPAPPTRRQSLG